MPLQNRVDPYGVIFRSPARGTMMGNRGGAIHNEQREIVGRYHSRRWIACVLEFKGRWRPVMAPRRYTELFFLDEAVALSAGHRPCAECRRERFNAFRSAWQRWAGPGKGALLADEMDLELHRARIDRRGGKVTYQASLDSLPDGCFVRIDGSSYLVWNEALLLWSPEGYQKKLQRPKGSTVTVLTPEPAVRCLEQGYRPEIHASSLAYRPREFATIPARESFVAIQLNSEQEHRIAEALRSGAYQGPAEVIDRALDILREQDEWVAANRQEMEAKINRGLQELDRGEGIPEDQVDAYLERLKEQME